jgi:hypothetical protein
MNFLRYGTRMLQGASPAGLLVGGTVMFLGFPVLRKGLRTLAVVVTRGVLSITDKAKEITAVSRESMEDIVREAKNADTNCPGCPDFTENMADLKAGSRRLAVAATVGVLNASDKAKSLYKDASEQVKNIVDEAKTTQGSSVAPKIEAPETTSSYHGAPANDAVFSKH